ncbi:MAG: hypothetical protein MJE77_12055 [Proteobacteria bacterium]|nr:hypothetical protein [Pseudomonadota bacterium]
MGRRAVIASGTAGVIVVAALVGWTFVQMRSGASGDQLAAASLAAGLRGARAEALSIGEPHHCARLARGSADRITGRRAEKREYRAGGHKWQRSGYTLRMHPPAARLVLGVVADARGVATHLSWIKRAFADRGVELVVSLGGMGGTETELAELLSALAKPASWPLVAIPGERESVLAHRAAVASLRDAGVVDGSRTRLIAVGLIALATLPGAPYRRRLIAGSDGCLHTEEDGREITSLLASMPGPRILLSHVPPRQRGTAASDVTSSGIHVGELWLTRAIVEARIQLAVHGLIAPLGRSGRGERPVGESPVFLAAGSADGTLDPSTESVFHLEYRPSGSTIHPTLALVITVEQDRMHWQRIGRGAATR